MQHLCVYSASQAIGATEADLAAVLDQVLTRQNSHYIFPTAMRLLAGYAQGTGMARARLNMPGLRSRFLPYLWPLSTLTLPGSDPNICDFRDSPLILNGAQELAVETTNSDAGAQTHTVCLWVGDGIMDVPAGAQVFGMRCTASITAVAGAWTAGGLTFGQTLPDGHWGVVGMQCQSTTVIAARLILPAYAWRPGTLGNATLAQRPPFQGRKFPLGLWGTFSNLALPQLEIFCTAADTAQVVHLDLIKM